MSQEKYIGMDVHQASISVAVMDASLGGQSKPANEGHFKTGQRE